MRTAAGSLGDVEKRDPSDRFRTHNRASSIAAVAVTAVPNKVLACRAGVRTSFYSHIDRALRELPRRRDLRQRLGLAAGVTDELSADV